VGGADVVTIGCWFRDSGTVIADRWSMSEMHNNWLKSGTVDREYYSCVTYCIMSRDVAEQECAKGDTPLEDGVSDASHLLSGWGQFWRGPGGAFGLAPVLVLYKHKVLIYQRRGLDV
jgi:hypothetical protein